MPKLIILIDPTTKAVTGGQLLYGDPRKADVQMNGLQVLKALNGYLGPECSFELDAEAWGDISCSYVTAEVELSEV